MNGSKDSLSHLKRSYVTIRVTSNTPLQPTTLPLSEKNPQNKHRCHVPTKEKLRFPPLVRVWSRNRAPIMENVNTSHIGARECLKVRFCPLHDMLPILDSLEEPYDTTYCCPELGKGLCKKWKELKGNYRKHHSTATRQVLKSLILAGGDIHITEHKTKKIMSVFDGVISVTPHGEGPISRKFTFKALRSVCFFSLSFSQTTNEQTLPTTRSWRTFARNTQPSPDNCRITAAEKAFLFVCNSKHGPIYFLVSSVAVKVLPVELSPLVFSRWSPSNILFFSSNKQRAVGLKVD